MKNLFLCKSKSVLVLLGMLAVVIHLFFPTFTASASITPTVSRSVIPPDTPTPVLVSVYIIDQTLIANSIQLLRVDASDKVTARLGILNDNGTDGDATSGDRIFSRQVTFSEPAGTMIRLRLSLAYTGQLKRVLSEIVTIQVKGQEGGQADSWGDPHLVTFDRYAYDFQAVGEFALVRSQGNNLEIQARMKPWGASRYVSVNTAAAMNVAGDIVGIYVDRNPFLYINHVATPWLGIPMLLPNGGRIENVSGWITVTWPDQSQVRVGIPGGYINLKVFLPTSRQGLVTGLLGNYDGDYSNDLTAKSGETLGASPGFNQLYKVFGESWRVSQAESLFDYVDGDTYASHVDLTFPVGYVTSANLSDSVRLNAQTICAGKGISDPVLLEACVLDVGMTGEATFAQWVAENIAAPAASNSVDSMLGRSSANPAKSCFDIQQHGILSANGKYWIKLPGGLFEMYCDFTSGGGGWTRVGTLDTTAGYCGNNSLTDLRFYPDASMGKVPDSDAQALMTQTPGSPREVMYYSQADSRYVWHALQNVTDFDTSTKHASSSFYCTNWQCDNGSTDSSSCGAEGNGCPVTAHGTSGFYKKIYVDSYFGRHILGMHVNGNMCNLPNYERASIWIYVR